MDQPATVERRLVHGQFHEARVPEILFPLHQLVGREAEPGDLRLVVAGGLAWWFFGDRGASDAELAAKAELTSLGALPAMDGERVHVNSINLSTLRSPESLGRALELLADLPNLKSLNVDVLICLVLIAALQGWRVWQDFQAERMRAAELERQLRVDAGLNITQERVMRVAFNGSGISKNNRVLERHDAVAPRWLATVRDIDRRGAWDDRLVDALMEQVEQVAREKAATP